MRNKIIRSLVFDKQVRLFFLDNTTLINEIININKHRPTIVNLLLGKLISGISKLSATLKGEQRLSVTITLSNPKHQMFVDIDAFGNVRGYANQSLLSIGEQESSIDELIGPKASIRIINGSHMNQFTGITDMPYQNIDADLAHYFRQSEQLETYIETDIAFGADHEVTYSYAMFAQLLPSADPTLLDEIRAKLNTKANLFQKLKSGNITDIAVSLKDYFNDIEIIGQHHSLQFSCHCSREIFYGLLQSMGTNHSNQTIESHCHNCGRIYYFQPDEFVQKKEDK